MQSIVKFLYQKQLLKLYCKSLNKQNYLLVGVGDTHDQSLRGDTFAGTYRPIIVAYLPVYYSFAWGKVITSWGPHSFYSVALNRLGTRVIASNYFTTRYLIVMDVSNGNVVQVMSKVFTNIFVVQQCQEILINSQYTSLATNDVYRWILMLLDDGSKLQGDSSRIVKNNPSSSSATYYQLAGYSTVSLQSNSRQNYLHVFSFASSICMLTVMNMATFTRVYQVQTQSLQFQISFINDSNYFIKCITTSGNIGISFQRCIHETSLTVDTIIFQEGTRFFRINNDQNKNSQQNVLQ